MLSLDLESSLRRPVCGFAAVVDVIRVNQLDESFVAQLHESVRSDFIECLEEKRREDSYES